MLLPFLALSDDVGRSSLRGLDLPAFGFLFGLLTLRPQVGEDLLAFDDVLQPLGFRLLLGFPLGFHGLAALVDQAGGRPLLPGGELFAWAAGGCAGTSRRDGRVGFDLNGEDVAAHAAMVAGTGLFLAPLNCSEMIRAEGPAWRRASLGSVSVNTGIVPDPWRHAIRNRCGSETMKMSEGEVYSFAVSLAKLAYDEIDPEKVYLKLLEVANGEISMLNSPAEEIADYEAKMGKMAPWERAMYLGSFKDRPRFDEENRLLALRIVGELGRAHASS